MVVITAEVAKKLAKDSFDQRVDTAMDKIFQNVATTAKRDGALGFTAQLSKDISVRVTELLGNEGYNVKDEPSKKEGLTNLVICWG